MTLKAFLSEALGLDDPEASWDYSLVPAAHS